jgi:uncharacterized protein YjiS (DUF1127 family)
MTMSAQPAFQPDAPRHLPQQGAVPDTRQAILFFGHVLDLQDPARIPVAANEPYRSAWADTWRRAISSCARLAGNALGGLLTWRDRAGGRRVLADLDARMLKDLGLTKTDVWRESNKPFWQS